MSLTVMKTASFLDHPVEVGAAVSEALSVHTTRVVASVKNGASSMIVLNIRVAV